MPEDRLHKLEMGMTASLRAVAKALYEDYTSRAGAAGHPEFEHALPHEQDFALAQARVAIMALKGASPDMKSAYVALDPVDMRHDWNGPDAAKAWDVMLGVILK